MARAFRISHDSLAVHGGTIEVVGGVLVMIGLFTRPAAFVMLGTMAFAYFMIHNGRGAFRYLSEERFLTRRSISCFHNREELGGIFTLLALSVARALATA